MDRVNIIHRTSLIPPSFGPVKTWCGRRVPLEKTGHVDIPGRKNWPWSKTT